MKNITLKCPKCGNIWDYGGEAPTYATCPDCLRKIKIDENKVKRK